MPETPEPKVSGTGTFTPPKSLAYGDDLADLARISAQEQPVSYDEARILAGMNEAIASDIVIPFKLIPPTPTGLHEKLCEMFKDAGVKIPQSDLMGTAAAPISAGEEQALRNVAYYRGIVQRIGELLGDECKTADDGVRHQDVLAETVLPVLRKRLGLSPLPVLAADAQFSPPEIAPKHQDNRIEMYVMAYIHRPGEKPLQIMTPWIVRDVTDGMNVQKALYDMVKTGTTDILAHVDSLPVK